MILHVISENNGKRFSAIAPPPLIVAAVLLRACCVPTLRRCPVPPTMPQLTLFGTVATGTKRQRRQSGAAEHKKRSTAESSATVTATAVQPGPEVKAEATEIPGEPAPQEPESSEPATASWKPATELPPKAPESSGLGLDAGADDKGVICFDGEGLSLNSDPCCSKCGFSVDPVAKGVRLLSKSAPSWLCGKCNSKQVQLTRMFGTWPLTEFQGIPADAQKTFWREPCGDGTSLKRAVEKHLVTNLVETKLASDSGPFLPLSVWSAKGYDIHDIEAKAKKELHPVLGWTYQVLIHSTGTEKKRELIRQEMSSLLGKGNKPGEASGGATTQGDDVAASGRKGGRQAVEKKDSSSSEDDDSTSSSSSSSDKKNKKKKHGKKAAKKHTKKKSAKKEEADRKAKEREGAKQERARVAKVKADSAKVMAKIGPVLLQLEDMIKDPSFGKVPSVFSKKAKTAITTLKGFQEEAMQKIKAKDPLDLTFGLEEMSAEVKDSVSTKTLLHNML